MKTAVVAIGGNAILPAGSKGTVGDQLRTLRETSRHLVKMVRDGYDIAITHGNGPQVGSILLQNERARDEVPRMPLDVCVAQSQAQIGYLLQQTLKSELARAGIERNVTSIITQVVVDENDPAFQNPTKPIGPYYTEEQAQGLMRRKGWVMMEDERGGFRRIVPSPKPIEIVEAATIKKLLFTGTSDEIVIVAGGGGIPVVRKNGRLVGVEAVIDKDRASAVLANSIGEKLLIMLTDVERVALNFGEPNQEDLERMTLEEAKRYMDEGHFPPGTMGPKIEASIQFLSGSGERVIITTPSSLEKALVGKAGTTIVKG